MNLKLYQKLLIALVLGFALGFVIHHFVPKETVFWLNSWIFEPLGQVFLRLIFMAVVPLVFCGLCLGVFELAQHRGLGGVAKRTLLYTLITSTISVLVGVGLTNLLEPGKGLNIAIDASSAAIVEQMSQQTTKSTTFTQTLVNTIPTNPVAAAARALDGEMLSLMLFALIFGVALSVMAKGNEEQKGKSSLISSLEDVFSASMTIVHFAMKISPWAVFALVFRSASSFGTQIIVALAFFVAVVLTALLIQQFLVYSVLLKAHGYSPLWFIKQCREVLLYAFATASSNATLPLSIQTAEEKLKLDPGTSRFVLTVGATANQNGSGLFEGVTVLFLAQVYGVDLTLGQQAQAVVMAIMAGVGTAGVPGGSLPLIMIVLQQLGIPAEGIGIILGVDRFLDMCRTTINVSGDLVIAALVDRKGPS